MAITLVDAWVYHPENWPPFVNWVPWFPVDGAPVPKEVLRAVAKAHDRIVYSKFALEQVNNSGLSAHYVPHGIDTNAIRPMPQMDARKRLGMPADAFIIGIVAANKGYPPRKSWPEMFEAFAKLRTKHNDAILFAHTNPTTQHGGVNLFEIAEQNGLRLGTDVFFPNQYQLVMGGLNDDGMSDLYSAMDVHLLASRGEGFGIPIVEAQACGCPVIVGDWTSMPELVFAGWKIPMSDARPEWSPLGGYQFAPRVGAIVDALEAAYTVRGNDEYRKRARAGAVKYDADVVFERYWLPVLAEITEGLPK